MVMPSTDNAISFNELRIELGFPNQTSFNIRDAEIGNYSPIQSCSVPRPTGSVPSSLSEWWAYAHNQTGSLYVNGDIGDSCFNACNSTPSIPCDHYVYNYNGTYYTTAQCNSLANTFIVPPTNCSGGTKVGQTCYEFSNGVLVSNSVTCTTCVGFGEPCAVNTDCCAPLTCGSGLTCTDQGD
jgi:hypothetical protein